MKKEGDVSLTVVDGEIYINIKDTIQQLEAIINDVIEDVEFSLGEYHKPSYIAGISSISAALSYVLLDQEFNKNG